MAVPKKSKPKTMDVAPPDSTLPDNSSRPLIVGNHSIMSDPMVVSPDGDGAQPTTSPLLADHVRQVQPLLPSSETTNKEQPTASPLAEASSDLPQTNPATAPTAEISDPPAEPLAKEPPLLAEPIQASEKAPKNEEALPDREKDPVPNDDKGDENSTFSDKDEPAPAPEEQTGKAEAEKAAEAEQAEHTKELIDEKTYFVPIHQGKQGGSWALFLFLLLMVAVGTIAYMMMTLNK